MTAQKHVSAGASTSQRTIKVWSLAVCEADCSESSLLAELFLEHLIPGSQILDHFLLFAIDPASENHQVELPGLKDKGHDCRDSEIFRIMLWKRAVN
jgi:hypothetical protein